MVGFVLKRIGGYAATLVAAAVFVFLAVDLLTGNLSGGSTAAMLRGDLSATIADMPRILQALSVTLPLFCMSAVLATIVGLPLGTLAGRASGSGASAVLGIFAAGPAVAFALLLMLVAGRAGLPLPGFVAWNDSAPAALGSLVLPALAAALPVAAQLALATRDAVRAVRRADFIRSAEARGLTFAQAVQRHGRRNVAVTVLAGLGPQLALLVASLYAVEIAFGLPGLAALLAQGIAGQDFSIIRSGALAFVGLATTAMLGADLLRAAVDPRIGTRIA